MILQEFRSDRCCKISPVGNSTPCSQENKLQDFLAGLTVGSLGIILIVIVLYNFGWLHQKVILIFFVCQIKLKVKKYFEN